MVSVSFWDGTHDGTHDGIVSKPEWESFEKVGVILQLPEYGIISIQVHQPSCFVLHLAIVRVWVVVIELVVGVVISDEDA